jgi:hypothetical protein
MPTRGPDLAMQKASEAYNNRLTKKSYDLKIYIQLIN